MANCPKVDRYGRQVCVVRVDGIDVGLAQIEAGLAWWYRKYARDQSPQDRASYAAVEQDAQETKRGLWRDRGTRCHRGIGGTGDVSPLPLRPSDTS